MSSIIVAWTLRASLPRPRRGAACAARDGKVMVMGGTVVVLDDDGDPEDEQPTASVLVYDPRADRWEASASSLPEPRWACRALTHDGILLVVGGGESPFCYANGTWAALADGIPTPTGGGWVGCFNSVLLG